jgi:hypothetical protein
MLSIGKVVSKTLVWDAKSIVHSIRELHACYKRDGDSNKNQGDSKEDKRELQ